jgi:sugar lactone lactonase YvrE
VKRSAAVAHLAVTVLAAAACGGEPGRAAGGWAGTIDTLPGGAVRVHSPATGTWKPGEEWKLVEELRIGSAEAEGPELFGDVVALEVDALGRIYVLESQAKEVRVFDARGAHVRTFGREGGGPGEFEQPAGLMWDPQGRLWIVDPQNARFSLFDTAGVFLTSHRRPGGASVFPWPGGMDSRGTLYDVAFVPREDGRPSFTLVRMDASMQPADTFRLPDRDGPVFEIRHDNGSRMLAGVPFAPGLVWRRDPGGDVWVGTSDRYSIARVSFEGDTLRVVERDYEPVPVTAAERDTAVGRLKWFTGQGGKVDASRIPGEKPAYGRVYPDEAGYLWVSPSSPEAAEGTALDVFDPEGRYLGQVRFGVELRAIDPFLVRGDRLYVVETDEMEVPYVVRYRIEGRPAAGARPSSDRTATR